MKSNVTRSVCPKFKARVSFCRAREPGTWTLAQSSSIAPSLMAMLPRHEVCLDLSPTLRAKTIGLFRTISAASQNASATGRRLMQHQATSQELQSSGRLLVFARADMTELTRGLGP